VKSIYSEHFLIQGQRGSFSLGNLHGHGIGKWIFRIFLFKIFLFSEYNLKQNSTKTKLSQKKQTNKE